MLDKVHIKGGNLGWLTNKFAMNSLSYVKCSLLGVFKVTMSSANWNISIPK